MGVVTGSSILVELLTALLVLATTLYLYINHKYNFWKNRRVPYLKPVFPYGSVKEMYLGKLSISMTFSKLYNEFKGEKYFGVFEGQKPTLVFRDPELIRHVLIKDFSHFTDRMVFPIDAKKDYITKHLFNLTGKEWKQMRLLLTPTFTSGKMKLMFFLMTRCSKQLNEFVNEEIKNKPEIEIKEALARFTMDIIASCAFGLETNCQIDKDNEFYQTLMRVFRPNRLTMIRRFLLNAFPFITKFYIPRFSSKRTQDFLTKIVKDTVEYREKNKVVRNDFLDLLIKIRQQKSLNDEEEPKNGHSDVKAINNDKPELTIEQMVAQAFIFFIAGFETASSTMSFCLYQLARHKDIQDKLYQEVQTILAKHDGQVTYQGMQEAVYMEQVINETLRMFSSLGVLNRTCSERYKVPGSDLVLERGQKVIIPIYGLQHDPQYYPNPEQFDPERFTPEKIKERHPCLHLPFGDGPRNCIGMRFGLLQTKIGLTEMLCNFEFDVSPNTQIPMKLHPTSFVTQPEKPILLRVTRRSKLDS